MRRLNLWQSFSVTYGLVATVIILFIGVSYSVVAGVMVEQTLHQMLANTGIELAADHFVFEDNTIKYKRAEDGATIADYLRTTGVSALIFDQQLERIGTYGVYRNLLDANLLAEAINQPDLETVLHTKQTITKRVQFAISPTSFETLTMPITHSGSVAGVLELSTPASVIEELGKLNRYLLFTLLPVGLIVMWLIAFGLSRRWLKPFETLVHLLRTTEAHRLTKMPRLPLATFPEIEELQVALKHLFDRIGKVIQSQQDFSAHAAHELKTPLTQAVTEIEVMLLSEKKAEKRKQLKDMKEDLLQMNRTLESLLALDLLETKTLAFHPRKVPILPLWQRILNELKVDLKAKDLKVETDVEAGAWWYMAPDHARLMLSNLVTNAIKYSGRRGTISITAETRKQKTQVRIKDTGLGISSNQIRKVFAMFFRTNEGKQKAGGMGVGLALIQTIAEKYRVKIEVRSKPGEGTEFVLVQDLKLNEH